MLPTPVSAGAPVPGQPGRWCTEARNSVGSASNSVLGAVAVVDVEIDHRDAPQPGLLGDPRADGDVGEEAEAHRVLGAGVMAGRPHGAERPRDLAGRHGSHRLRDSPGRALRGVDEPGETGVSGSSGTRPRAGSARERGLEVMRGVHEGEVRRLDRLGGLRFEVEVAGLVQGVQHRRQPLRPFRVAEPV